MSEQSIRADALHFTTNAVLELLDHEGLGESQFPSNAKPGKGPYARSDKVDIRQFAKRCLQLYLKDDCPSDRPLTPGGHSALHIQAGFAIYNAHTINGGKHS